MGRVIVISILLLTLTAGCVGYGVRYNGSEAYVNSSEISANYPSHIGESVHIWGGIIAEEGGTVIIKSGNLRLQVTEPATSDVQPGDSIQVYGVLQPDRQLTTVSYHTQSPVDKQYMYIVSLFGVVLAIASFFRRWRVDITNARFVPRKKILSVRGPSNPTRSGEEGTDEKNTLSRASGKSDSVGERDG